MKEQILIEMRNKIETLANIANQLIQETNNIKQLAVGTLQTIKQMPDYEQAISKLKDQAAEQSSKAEEADALGKDSN